MGTWGFEPFENDNAQDWLINMAERGLGLVETTLDKALRARRPDKDDMQEAIAAVVIVTLFTSGPGKDAIAQAARRDVLLNDRVVENLKDIQAVANDRVIDKARKVLVKVQNKSSPLQVSWSESKHFKKWKRSLEDLESRL